MIHNCFNISNDISVVSIKCKIIVGASMEFAVESTNVMCSGVCEKNRIRILHVDDDAGFLAVAKQCLEETGEFEIDTAGSAEEALTKLNMLDFEAVVADYQMSGMNGLELLRELRREGNHVPFFLFTCKTIEEIAIEALNSGGGVRPLISVRHFRKSKL